MNESIISVVGLTKDFGRLRAVDELTFEVARGRVTGFLGPNGAGKTTTIRMILGLARPTSGEALVAGTSYSRLQDPARVVGTLIDGAGAHPKRTGRDHLRILATERGIPVQRVGEALDLAGIADSGDRQVGDFSLGMRQRLGLAAALLGDPELLILDEPANGLDPAGIRWLRSFLRSFADGGRSVFVSSHQLGEIAQLADEVVVLNRGRFVTHKPVAALTEAHGAIVRTPQRDQLVRLLRDTAATVTLDGDRLVIEGIVTAIVGEIAAREGIVLHELSPTTASLEDVFLSLTASEGGIR
jgi:ABC-2 type transport system ATP-binding protein